jgi:hypothetical protein
VSTSSRPDPDELPDSLPEDAAADVHQQQEGVYTAETPERRAESDAPSAEHSGVDES